MYVQRDHQAPTKGVRLSVGLIVASGFLRDCISVLISRRAPDLELLTASSVSELHSVSLSLIVLWADPLKGDAHKFVHSESSLARERRLDIPVLAFVPCPNAGNLTSFMPMGITAIDIDRATPEIALAAIQLAIAGEVVTSSSLVRGREKEVLLPPRLYPGSAHLNPIHMPNREHGIFGTGITKRELELLEKVHRGLPNKLIAYELGISESTVKVHMRNLMRKLKATNRTQVAFLVNQLGAKATNVLFM
jgi:DNA-binding NarL/FixJ family response regulator